MVASQLNSRLGFINPGLTLYIIGYCNQWYMAHWLRNLRIYRLMDHEGPWKKIIIPQAGVTLFLGNPKIHRSCNSHTKPRFLYVFMVVLKCFHYWGKWLFHQCNFANPILPGPQACDLAVGDHLPQSQCLSSLSKPKLKSLWLAICHPFRD